VEEVKMNFTSLTDIESAGLFSCPGAGGLCLQSGLVGARIDKK